MRISIISLFPDVFSPVLNSSILKRAQDKGLVYFELINLRDFGEGLHKVVDDRPYGGGGGMILKVDVVMAALESIVPKPYTILLSATGTRFKQTTAKDLTQKKSIAIICGHYEGVDARIEHFVDDVVSIGDFILTGGEIAAMAIVDSVIRLIPGVIHPESLKSESFSLGSPSSLTQWGILEYPQYTRPEDYRGLKVPQILLSGNHQQIKKWREKETFARTKKFRPDLLEKSKIPGLVKRSGAGKF